MNICVFCSCSPIGEPYHSAVRELGRTLGSAGHALVYGGFAEGLMGAIADGFAEVEAPVIGVVPRDLVEAGRLVHPGCGKVMSTEGLTERKTTMIELADAFVTAPGGIGTLDELFSVLGMVITHEIAKPVVVYDVDGFYAQLQEMLRDMERSGFIRGTLDTALGYATTPEEVLALCQTQRSYDEAL